MTTFKKITLSSVAFALTAVQTFAADGASLFGTNKVTTATGTTGELTSTIQRIIGSILGIMAVVAVLFGIYAGFLMVTAGGEEDKMKKGRTIMIQVAIGLIVIFLANAAVKWFMTVFGS